MISSWKSYPDCKIYTIEDFIVDTNGVKTCINSREKRVSNIELNFLDDMIKTVMDFSSMKNTESAWMKAKIGLLLFIQNDLLGDTMLTIYGKKPEDWELSPNVEIIVPENPEDEIIP